MLTDHADASPRQAAETLEGVVRLRRRTRRSLGSPWFPLICFGLLTILSAPLVAAMGTAVLAPLWLVAGTAGMLLTRRHYRRRARQRGVTGRGRRSWAIACTMSAGAFIAGVTGGSVSGEAAGVMAPIVVIVTGYLLLGALQRDPRPSLALAPGAILATVLVLEGQAPWIVELAFGAGLVAAGTALRALEDRP